MSFRQNAEPHSFCNRVESGVLAAVRKNRIWNVYPVPKKGHKFTGMYEGFCRSVRAVIKNSTCGSEGGI